MKKPFLFFALKCSVIFYFAACTRIENYTASQSAIPLVTGKSCVIYFDADNNTINDLEGYTFNFHAGGDVTAVKNGQLTKGNWSEDNISKKIVIDIPGTDKLLSQLNQSWIITNITEGKINLEQQEHSTHSRLSITSATM